MRIRRYRTFLALLFLSLISTVVHGDLEYKVLLMMRKGGNGNLNDLWSTTGGANDEFGNGSTNPITNLLRFKTFRSKDIENLSNQPPQKMYFQALDSQGNVIWETRFLTSNTIFGNNLADLLLDQDIDGQTSYFPPGDVGLYWGNSEHQMAIHPKDNFTTTYFSIWNKQTSTDYPLFLFPRQKTISQPLYKATPGVYEYFGCFTYLHTNMTAVISNSASMTLALCAVACAPTAQPYLGIEHNKNCHCGDLSTAVTPHDMGVAHCNIYTCTGTADLCGGALGLFAVYHATISLPIPGSEPTLPQKMKYINTYISYNPDNPVDITQHASRPIYMDAVYLSNEGGTDSFKVHYSRPHPCNATLKTALMDASHMNVMEFQMGTLKSVGIIEASCIWITMVGATNVVTGTKLLLRLALIDPSEAFISAPAIAILGERFVETTTSEATTAQTTTEAAGTTALTTVSTTASTTAGLESTASTTTGPTSTVSGGTATSQSLAIIGDSTPSTHHQTTAATNTALASNPVSLGEMCMCTCYMYREDFNMTRTELIARLKQLRKELFVNVTELSSYIRRYISASDDRPSAAGVGAVGVMILVFVFGTIIVLDLTSFLKLRK